MAALEVLPEPQQSLCQTTLSMCAYAGTGDVLVVQQMLHICSKHYETDVSIYFYNNMYSSSAYWCPHCWGTTFPYGLHIRRTGRNPPSGPSAGWWVIYYFLKYGSSSSNYLLLQNEQSSAEDTAFKKQDKKDAKEGTSSSSSSSSASGSSKEDKSKSKQNIYQSFISKAKST
jgi:hypothetical protein